MLKRVLPVLIVAIVLVAILILSQSRGDSHKVSGYVEADEIRLGSRIGGRVQAVLVEEGDRVENGQELVRLEPFDLIELEQEAVAKLAMQQAVYDKLLAGFRDEEIEQSKARYDRLAARLQLLENGPRQEEIQAAEGRLRVADADFAAMRRKFDRVAALMQNDAIAQEEYDAAEQQFKAAESQVVVNQKELEILELGTRQEEIIEAQAQLAEARASWNLTKNGYRKEDIAEALAGRDAAVAALDAIRERMSELVIRSPVNGSVESLELRPGDLVAGSAPVLSLVDHARLWVRAYVPENRLDLELGQKLSVTVDSYPDEMFAGELTFISRQAEFTPSNVQTPDERSKQVFRIKVTLDETAQRLRPGMAADVWLQQPPKE